VTVERFEDWTYHDEGGREAEVVVLLHGWPTSSLLWRRLTPMLATRFRVLVPDLPHGGLRAQAEAVRRLLSHLGVERFAAVGHSHGGGVAQLLAFDDVGVGSLVLIDSVGLDGTTPTDLDPRTFIERGSVEFASLPDEDLAAYLSGDPGPAPEAEPALAQHADAMAAWTFPVFMLWGEDDPFTPVQLAERLNEAIPASTLGVVPESGHFLLDDAFETVGGMIHEYLRARYLGAPHGHEGVVMLQLERRAPWIDLAPLEEDDDEPDPPAADQEVGPNP
jgi:pimeloyl-ACP methyl ester carboxylesterase